MTQDTQAGAGAQPAPALQPEALRIAMHLRQRAQLSRPGNLDTLSASGANELERQHAALSAAQSEAKHWRTNHDNVVSRLRIFTQRPDIPKELADRLPWYRELVRLQAAAGQAAAKGLHQSTEDAAITALKGLLSLVRREAPQLSGKVLGDAESAIAALQAAPPAPAEHAATLWVEENGCIDFETSPFFVKPPGEYQLYTAPPAPAAVAVPDERTALARLESACDRRAKLTTPEAYKAIASCKGMYAALDELDEARTQARAALAAAPALASDTESVLIDGIAYEVPAAVAGELLSLHLDLLAADPAQEHATQLAGQALPADEFRGDTASLVRNIIALLDLDAQGCLVPHGVGGHARGLLSAAASRLAASDQAQGCTRSHPHENMSPMCVLRTEIARLNHAAAIAQVTAAPVAHPHHCTARSADGACEECEGHAQGMAEWRAEAAAPAQAQEDARDTDALKASRDTGINHGVCLALQIMHAAGDAGGTQWDELLSVAGRDEMESYAKHVEPDEWELCGFGQVERREAEIQAIGAAQGGE